MSKHWSTYEVPVATAKSSSMRSSAAVDLSFNSQELAIENSFVELMGCCCCYSTWPPLSLSFIRHRLAAALTTTTWLMTLLLILTISPASVYGNCGGNVTSGVDSQYGEITSPAELSPNMQCIYRLIGREDERVRIEFQKFELKGVLPRCQTDYIDIYIQASHPFENLLYVPLLGRYCGNDVERLPKPLISMTNVMVIALFTDSSADGRANDGFRMGYEFIKNVDYNVGTNAGPNIKCGRYIQNIDVGILLSPTYPGMYPDNINCFYKIQGKPGQRIKLTFHDIDLYSGGDHCPFDYIKVYDGMKNEAEVIETYCGIMSKVVVFSTNSSLNIDFVTKSGRPEPTKKTYLTYDEKDDTDAKRRGFNATFEISDSFFDLSYIQGHHIRGTECDQLILSPFGGEGDKNGTVTSPYYPNPYPLNTTCLYYIDGLQDKQNLEKVEFQIEDIDIPKVGNNCSNNGYLRAFLQGKSPKPESSRYDEEFCGRNAPSRTLTTTNPRLLLVFDSHGTVAGRGFKARYHFVTDYAISGTPATSSVSQCHYVYHSSSVKQGTFHSPRYPSYYPDNTHCIYEFLGEGSEMVRITFKNFRLEEGYPHCTKDSVRVYNVNTAKREEVLIGQYCGNKLPGPQMSEENSNSLKVILYTNEKEQHQGFSARYEFVDKKCPSDKQCIYNITGEPGGLIQSPNYPYKYSTNGTFDWYIYSRRKDGAIMLIFDKFEIEGNPEGPQGCGNAVLKIYTNSSARPSYELCGRNTTSLIGQGGTILSQTSMLRIKFISTGNAVGGKGFTMAWSDVMSGPKMNRGRCHGFLCKKSMYCISNELKCNKYKNCGNGDDSDEPTSECGRTYRQQSALNIILGVVMTLIAVIVVIGCFIHRRRRRQNVDKKKKEIEVRYVTRSASEDRDGVVSSAGGTPGTRTGSRDAISVNSGQNLFREQTEKVSIV